jgi:hypothetical protein
MDALELLKQDHQKVKQLFEQCQAAKDKKRQKQIFIPAASGLSRNSKY